jgi:hypothetical protein
MIFIGYYKLASKKLKILKHKLGEKSKVENSKNRKEQKNVSVRLILWSIADKIVSRILEEALDTKISGQNFLLEVTQSKIKNAQKNLRLKIQA